MWDFPACHSNKLTTTLWQSNTLQTGNHDKIQSYIIELHMGHGFHSYVGLLWYPAQSSILDPQHCQDAFFFQTMIEMP